MTYTTTELSKITGFTLSKISSLLHRMGFSPVGIAGKNQNIWDEECLEVLQKKKRMLEKESTICLVSLSTMFNASVPDLRKILTDKGIQPVMVERNEQNGSLIERYPYEVKDILIKHFDDLKADNADEHPLVTDKRCLRLNWWPDIVPKCFEDLDAEIA